MNQSTLNLGDYAPDPGFTIAAGEQPQQRLETFGAGALSDTELIAIMLHTGIHGRSVLGLASQLISQAGSIAGLASWQSEDFRRLKGIGQSKGRQLAALIEISRRMAKQPVEQAPVLNRPELIAAHMAPYVRGLEVEKFWVLCLNRKNRLRKLVDSSTTDVSRRRIASSESLLSAADCLAQNLTVGPSRWTLWKQQLRNRRERS